MRFKFLTGDMNWQTYGGKFISKKLNNSEFDYWLVMDVVNLKDAMGDESEYTYNVSIAAIAPSQLPHKELDSALSCCGIEEDKENLSLEVIIKAISTYMGGAIIFNESGNNLNALMKQARYEASLMGGMLFGFAMDKYQNRIGSTGWDILRGDILGGLHHE